MSALFHRAIDIALIVLGAFGALHLNLNVPDVGPAHRFDPTLVAFAAALALSVFPACGTYPSRGSRSVMSVASRTAFAWLAVQLCALALLYGLHRDHLISMPWFIYWTFTSGISLLASHTLFVGGFSVARHAGAWLRRGHATREPLETRSRTNVMKHAVKRVFDIVVGLTLIVMLLPVLVLLALIVKSDGGPALYGHTRVGRNGRKFRCLKFRSMVVNSKEVLEQLLATDPEARAEWEREFKLKHDVRVTRIGRFLRRTSLDELPQLLNVVRGEMSLVGPRPIIDQELERYGTNSKYYLMATPGITGLWQVSGRCETDYATRVSLDVNYVQNWSLHRDIEILFKTFFVVIRGTGAY
ncbi:sugar transferase [Paraburkholderia pallida]|uniref:UDP-phosphate galactose phosphotransferase n=1 Tax=Paraburkholderia pallida TaxID=2547399 RepID=A0A4P7CVY0_9BURK|nr:sugar transferase [Paraburkholderia pallida]QBQ98389.1 UDP-phosphate galactose phosphotransferase [Paraburkholderia pallida]